MIITRTIALCILMGLTTVAFGGEARGKIIISSDKAPKAIGPYSQAVQVGNTVYLAGQIAIDPATGEMSDGDIEMQTHQVLKNINAVLKEAGYTLGDVVTCQVFLADLSHYQAMNTIYASYFPDGPPARAVVEVKRLPRDALLEIMVTAAR